MSKQYKIPQEIVDEAKEVDLIEFCQRNGIALLDENSNNPKLLEHDSLVFFKGNKKRQWHRFSTDEGGNAIDFIKFYYPDISFRKAVSLLMNGDIEDIRDLNLKNKKTVQKKETKKHRESFKYNNYEVKDFSKARDYLVNERQISENIVNILYEKGFIRQDARDNVVFKWFDVFNGNKLVGANMQGTEKNIEGRSYKRTHKNTTTGKGFNLLLDKPKNIKIFESSIDLLSYLDLNKEELKDNWLISMEGLKGIVLKEAVKDLEDLQKKDSQFKVNTITFCLDSDDKAKKYIKKHINDDELFKKIGNPKIEIDLPKHTVDWNDELKYFNNINQEKVCMLDNSYDL